jgi:hypothetical protein
LNKQSGPVIHTKISENQMKKNNTLIALGLLASASTFAAEESYTQSSYPYGSGTITTGFHHFPSSGLMDLINPGNVDSSREITRVLWNVGFMNDSSRAEKIDSDLTINNVTKRLNSSIQGSSAHWGDEFVFTDTNSNPADVLTVGEAKLKLVTHVTANWTNSLKHKLFNYEVFYTEIPKNVYSTMSNGNTITIDWDDAEGAHHYIKEVSFNWSAFKNATTLTISQATYPNQENGNFRYRVKSCDSQDYCGSWSQISPGVVIQPDLDIPSTPTSATSFIGGGYQVIGSTLTVGIAPIFLADYYEIYYSDDGIDYSKVATTWNTTETVNIRSTYGYFYIRYKACNNSGCSDYSPTQRGLAYTFSAYPRSLTSSAYNLAKNESFTLTIEQAGGSVDGTVYELEESFNGDAYSKICTRTRATWQDMFFLCPVSGKSQSGSYRYRVKACNPSVSCSGYAYSGYVEVVD